MTSLEELVEKKKRGQKLSRKENFRLLSSRVSKEWHRTGWSSAERRVAKLLEERLHLKEREDYWHNYKIQIPSQRQYYSLDFYFPDKRIVLEISPAIWHKNLGSTEEKDRRKREWLERIGLECYILGDRELAMSDERLTQKLRELLEEKLSKKILYKKLDRFIEELKPYSRQLVPIPKLKDYLTERLREEMLKPFIVSLLLQRVLEDLEKVGKREKLTREQLEDLRTWTIDSILLYLEENFQNYRKNVQSKEERCNYIY